MIDDQCIKIRPLIIDDLARAIGLSSSEGWNQTETDWRLLIENPNNICIAAESEGKVIGTATALNHSDKVVWIGMVIVDKAFRGLGIGKLLMTSIIDKLKHFESVRLDATPAGLPLYRKLGFIDELIVDRMVNQSFAGKNISANSGEPRSIYRSDFPEILKHDEKVFGTSRSYLLEKLFSDYPAKAYRLGKNNKTEGYIFGRDGLKYNYIGPVVAVSDKAARILISKAMESLKNKPAVLDILQDKEGLIKWLEELGFQKQRQFTRMYLNGNSHKGIIKNYYLISGPEYG
jgi:ribosomal protein S18 acetylase RimI-like enzyme